MGHNCSHSKKGLFFWLLIDVMRALDINDNVSNSFRISQLEASKTLKCRKRNRMKPSTSAWSPENRNQIYCGPETEKLMLQSDFELRVQSLVILVKNNPNLQTNLNFLWWSLTSQQRLVNFHVHSRAVIKNDRAHTAHNSITKFAAKYWNF